jgi:hypothetical protein
VFRVGLDRGREEDAAWVRRAVADASSVQARADQAVATVAARAKAGTEQLDAALVAAEAASDGGAVAALCRDACANAVAAAAAQQQQTLAAQGAAAAELRARAAGQVPSDAAVRAVVAGCLEEAVALRDAQVARLQALAASLQSDVKAALRREECLTFVASEVHRLLAAHRPGGSSGGQSLGGRSHGGQSRGGQSGDGDDLGSARSEDSAGSSAAANWLSAGGLRGGRLTAPPQQPVVLR